VLESFVANVWACINNKSKSEFKYESGESGYDKYVEAILKVSVVIELLRYEIGYESINFSTAVGEMVVVCWMLSFYDKELAEQCKDIYNSIENHEFSIDRLENFRLKLISMRGKLSCSTQ
jgi:hypothetical protein